jgi:hypothetical protein
MSDPTAEFFAGLATLEYQPLLAKVNGMLRFDIADVNTSETWFVVIDRGTIDVSHDPPDEAARITCSLRCSRQLFDGVVTGQTNAMAALLRGEVTFDGDPELMLLFQRIFPGPPAPAHSRTPTGERS